MSSMNEGAFRAEARTESRAFVAFGSWVFAMDLWTGKRTWYAETHASHGGFAQYQPRVIVVGDRVVTAVGKTLTCLAQENGAMLWRVESPIHPIACIVTEGVVLAGNNGEAAAFDLRDGKLLWHDPFTNLGTGLTTLAASNAASKPTLPGRWEA